MYEIKVSSRKNKKYDVFKHGKLLVSFGDSRYEHFEDKIGAYSHLDHKDERRRMLYYARHGIDAKKDSAKYFSHKFLW